VRGRTLWLLVGLDGAWISDALFGAFEDELVKAAVLASFIPIVLDRIGIDPAMATDVFITTGNDILSVMIFFALVSLFYL
jgi:magnesium transporter